MADQPKQSVKVVGRDGDETLDDNVTRWLELRKVYKEIQCSTGAKKVLKEA